MKYVAFVKLEENDKTTSVFSLMEFEKRGIRECTENTNKSLADAEAERIVEMALSVIEERWQREHNAMTSPQDVKNYLRLKLSHEKQEMFSALFLDSKHRVIAYEALFRGTIDSTRVHTRVVAQKALENNAASLIVAHNHPSGISIPSLEDKRLTEKLMQSLQLLDIRLLDHFIVGQGEPYSMAELGEMPII